MRIVPSLVFACIFANATQAQEHRVGCNPAKVEVWFAEQPRIVMLGTGDEAVSSPDEQSILIVERNNPAMQSIIWSHGPTDGQMTVQCGEPTYVRVDGKAVLLVIMQKSQDLEVFWGEGSEGTVESVTISDAH